LADDSGPAQLATLECQIQPGSGLSGDEQNNARRLQNGARRYITSIVYRENWFFQLYPEKGTGGFVISETDAS
jgi:hypothetical protein